MSLMGHERRIRAYALAAGRPQTADPAGGQGGFRLGPGADSCGAANIGYEVDPAPSRPQASPHAFCISSRPRDDLMR
jgi:hypothetical protein